LPTPFALTEVVSNFQIISSTILVDF